jgi:hypothetical protein
MPSYKDFQIIVSHTADTLYLEHCLDILVNLGFNKSDIWVDGFHAQYSGTDLKQCTTHKEYHGARCFNLLTEATSDYVVIVDSDFFCTDQRFWVKAWDLIQDNYAVSIAKNWCFGIQMLTTPFVAYNRKEALKFIPEKQAWNHLNKTFTQLPDPLFDNLQYMFFIMLYYQKAALIDHWNIGNRAYKFCHLWDSRHTYQYNFDTFNSNTGDHQSNLVYLAHGVSKYLFSHVSGNDIEFDDKMWEYIQIIKDESEEAWMFLIDTMVNMGDQIDFKAPWLDRYRIVADKFQRDVC